MVGSTKRTRARLRGHTHTAAHTIARSTRHTRQEFGSQRACKDTNTAAHMIARSTRHVTSMLATRVGPPH